MTGQTEPARLAYVASPDRSFGVQVWPRVGAGGVVWGATWSAICGALAAETSPWAVSGGLLSFAAAWFAVVPLAGAAWAPLVGAAARGSVGRQAASSAEAERPVKPMEAGQRRWLQGLSEAPWTLLFGLSLALTLAALLGSAPALLLAAGLAAFFLARLVGGRWPGPGSLPRSMLEIGLPALFTWLVFGASRALPVSLQADQGMIQVGMAWARHNWAWPLVALAFTIVHFASTAVRGRRDLPARRRDLSLGYALAVAALALAAEPWGAGLVALLFVLQWPFQVAFAAGRVRWHFLATQSLAMAAMACAALALGR